MNEGQERFFLEKLAAAPEYPDSLICQDERRATRKARAEHYADRKHQVFDGDSGQRDNPLIIIDFGMAEPPAAGLLDDDFASEKRSGKKADLHVVRGIEGLRNKLSWPDPKQGLLGPSQLKRDPPIRVVLLERMWPTSLLLNLSEDVLLEILTYHQVPAHFLSFVTSGGDSWSFASSMSFAGFKGCTTTLPPGPGQQPSLAVLGRSGRHIQVCLTLFRICEYPLHALPGDVDPARTPRWETHSAAVYVHFDIVEGTAVWLLASPRSYHPEKGKGTQNLLWNTLKEGMVDCMDGLRALDVPERFRISIDNLLAAAEWSTGMFSHHVQDTEKRLHDLTEPYVYPYDDEEMVDDRARESIHAQDLRRMAFLMETRHRSVMEVENNLRVLRRLREFFVDEVAEHLGPLRDSHADEIRTHIKGFAEKLTSKIAEIEDLLDRATALDKLARNREEYIQRLQTHHSTQQMKTIAVLTADDSSAMKQLSFITLILLPVTVVSTVLGTDIVKFQDLSNENGNATRSTSEGPVPMYNFSVAAFGTWAVASVLMTIATLIIVRPVGNDRRPSGGNVGGGSNGSPMEKTWVSRMKGQLSRAWNIRDRFDSAEKSWSSKARSPSPAVSALATSIHTAPTVVKTASNSRETPLVGVGAPVHAKSPQTWTSTGWWLGYTWEELRRTAKNKLNMSEMATTPLPRWDSRRDEGREVGQKPRGEDS
ncbi:hypothetical protein CORC01_06875 [Colletotrichum orchidophilum]|uniref:CorA-like transporter domain-containing protein n=1 Tax=Colletotrichum orchidophilum TaxID=1209926 RepID=A0A1G4B8S9_9PEZI|nr:uncharacterized protein CORC01_06875 [Colletotrichum orchidophilum]OHE97840.1 hypothetical protein CORC01_06875 [Colletotrichum orchidophilum]